MGFEYGKGQEAKPPDAAGYGKEQGEMLGPNMLAFTAGQAD
jgi:hypothetical protein